MSWNARIKHEQGKRRHLGPPTAMKKVLVHTNPHYHRLLQEQMAVVDKDRMEALRRLKWQRQTFVIDTAVKETELRELEMPHTSHLPEIDMKTTVPDVRARRPIVTTHARRSSSTWMMRDAGMEPTNAAERPELRDTTLHRERQVQRSRPRSGAQAEMMRDAGMEPTNAPAERPDRLRNTTLLPRERRRVQRSRPRSGAQAERHYGSSLPLYGQDHEMKRRQKRLEEVTRLQEEFNSRNIQGDPRFCKLTDSLTGPAVQ